MQGRPVYACVERSSNPPLPMPALPYNHLSTFRWLIIGKDVVTCQIANTGYMAEPEKPQFELIAGHPALDFVNTLGNRPDPSLHQENLRTLDDLLLWGELAGILSSRDGSAFQGASPRHAAKLVEQAIQLREVIYRIVGAL